ncbi:MAG: hypothetical protein Q8K75_05795 [Chlamydiales bacterium]|nr:hypothetical protein [Chlamydiales bacterium]
MLVLIDGHPEGILKFSYSENPMTLARGIYAGEGPLRERLATIVSDVLTDYTGLDFGVARTDLVYTEDPMDNAKTPDLHLGSLQFFIDDAKDVKKLGKESFDNVSDEEFQKFVFHIIMVSADAHLGNILLKRNPDSDGYEVYLIDMSNSLPRSSENGYRASLYGWLMHSRSGHYLSDKWRERLSRLNVPRIVSEIRKQWKQEMKVQEVDDPLPEETWDLLTISLSTVKYGAQYNRSLRSMASIFIPVALKEGEDTKYYGGEIEDIYTLYYDKQADRWQLDGALEQIRQILSKEVPRKETPTAAPFTNVQYLPDYP